MIKDLQVIFTLYCPGNDSKEISTCSIHLFCFYFKYFQRLQQGLLNLWIGTCREQDRISSLLLSQLMNTARQPSGCSVCLWASPKPAKGVLSITVVFIIMPFPLEALCWRHQDISVGGVKAIVAPTVAAWAEGAMTPLLYFSLTVTCRKMSQGQ